MNIEQLKAEFSRHKEHGAYCPDSQYTSRCEVMYVIFLNDYMTELIGHDEEFDPTKHKGFKQEIDARNELRAEQRERLDKL